MERYLYFRTQATDGDDDNTDDSACYPASSLMGMAPSSDSTLTLAFKPILRRTPSGNEPDADASFDNHDLITLTLTTNNTHLKAMKAIAEAATKSHSSLVVVANDDSGGTEYLSESGIASVDTIVVRGVYAN